jgi:hypothetical protein
MAQVVPRGSNLSRLPIDASFLRFSGPVPGRRSPGNGPRPGDTARLDPGQSGFEGEGSRLPGEVVELSLLLPDSQLEALEQEARSRGLTTAQLLRRLVDAFLVHTST